ncbi:MAG: hypothetical protein KC776_30515 [Myxococcales bacterium]|nr:hypothetical protein [Myxococcales bacterium]MCB9581273.1 hypothetical protein [Polyangiaceae bacterium]
MARELDDRQSQRLSAGRSLPSNPSITTVFALLDRWRHLPAYQLERRADVFFALYLREVVSAHVGVELHTVMIPELPLRRGMLYGDGEPSPNKTAKADYLLATASCDTFYLLELKTAQTSRRTKQDQYLELAKKAGLRAIVDGVIAVAAASSSKYLQKYLHLLSDLSALGLVEVPAQLYDEVFPSVRARATRGLAQVRNLVGTPEPPLRILYVQPEAESAANTIGFAEYAAIVNGHDDDVSRAFARALRQWIEPAGQVRPTSL